MEPGEEVETRVGGVGCRCECRCGARVVPREGPVSSGLKGFPPLPKKYRHRHIATYFEPVVPDTPSPMVIDLEHWAGDGNDEWTDSSGSGSMQYATGEESPPWPGGEEGMQELGFP